jgi:hypothetical protein
MVIDRTATGRALPDVRVTIERGRLRLFAKAIGETDAVYTLDSTDRRNTLIER